MKVEREKAHAAKVREWQSRKEIFSAEQHTKNAAVDAFQASYLAGEPSAVGSYCDLVLSFSDYPDFMPNEWDIEYSQESGVLIADYSLPAPDALPTLVEVKYVASRDETTEKHLSPAQAANQYDYFVYQVALRTVHELFEADHNSCFRHHCFQRICALNRQINR